MGIIFIMELLRLLSYLHCCSIAVLNNINTLCRSIYTNTTKCIISFDSLLAFYINISYARITTWNELNLMQTLVSSTTSHQTVDSTAFHVSLNICGSIFNSTVLTIIAEIDNSLELTNIVIVHIFFCSLIEDAD